MASAVDCSASKSTFVNDAAIIGGERDNARNETRFCRSVARGLASQMGEQDLPIYNCVSPPKATRQLE
jgi:hypothetical protein